LPCGAVIQTGKEHFVAVGVDIVEGLLLMLGQGVEREVEENAKINPSRVASNAVPRPLVTLLMEPTILLTSSTLEKLIPLMAEESPTTVPMNPSRGIAHKKARSRM